MEEKEIMDLTTRFVAICDDEEIYRIQCRNMCMAYFRKKEQKVEILEFSSTEELMGCKKRLHIIFLDIQMPGLSGIEAKRMLARTQPEAAIIFMTNYPEYMDVAFGRNVSCFLTKPLDMKKIYIAIKKVYAEVLSREDYIIISDKKIILSQVMYIKGEDKYVSFETYGGNYILIRGTLNEWEEALSGKNFLRIHKSYIINLEWIGSIKTRLALKDRDRRRSSLPISKQKKERLIEEYGEYLRKNAY